MMLLDYQFNMGLGYGVLTPFATIFQLNRRCQFYWWRKPDYPEENSLPVANHPQILSYNVVSCTPPNGRDSNSQL